ncbi:hypothetical protein DACRYDRAFT_114608 [Dacryopinax primogenitus]|uniref:Uncharacterized protein n=1 Tax=Dacryopinax primogenitus (strain DJM 731) TaxID=1858805 RepID=M5G7Y0_DACPD|nr:uncharacterized protein DACRYDRAFT_114608 [Dacryopinax primogenitus]EJU04240.1 hypothetical protein DACRYDRAFT_114608 [Dacryopinax primogenitus]
MLHFDFYTELDELASLDEERPISPTSHTEIDVPFYEATLTFAVGHPIISIRMDGYFAIYGLQWERSEVEGASRPTVILCRRWTIQTCSETDGRQEADEHYVTAFCMGDEGTSFYLEHQNTTPKSSAVRMARCESGLHELEGPIFTPRGDSVIVLESSGGDLLRHIDYLSYWRGSLVLGRKLSYLWFRIPISDPKRGCGHPSKVLDPPDTQHPQPEELASNAHFLAEWRSRHEPAFLSESARIMLPVNPDDVPEGYIWGTALEEYTNERIAVPMGDNWYMKFGAGITAPAQRILVCKTVDRFSTIFRIEFHKKASFFRLDRYYDDPGLHGNVDLRYWNQEKWQDCIRDTGAGSSDRSIVGFGF